MLLLKRKFVSLSCFAASAAATTTAFRSSTTTFFIPRATRTASSLLQPQSHHPSSDTIVRRMTTTTSTPTSTTFDGNRNVFWNREESQKSSFSGPIVQSARILSLANPNDPNNEPLHTGQLPDRATLLAIGTSLEEFDIEQLKKDEPNVLFVSHPKAREPLADLLRTFPSIQWVHTRSAGIDFCTSPALTEYYQKEKIMVTNAKGCFSSTLAEYTMMACSYFAKDLPRLLQQKRDAQWQQYPILELRGATLGVIGFGDIGQSAAKLAKAYGMKVVALRRRRKSNTDDDDDSDEKDPIADKVVYGKDAMNQIFAESDYVLCAAPLTPETEKMIGKEQFDYAGKNKKNGGPVFINVGRGPIVDEDAMIEALQDGRLKGAGLDVTAIEPLPADSPLWTTENVLLSPHNMDMTMTFMKESTQFFVDENLPRFLYGMPLLNPVDPAAGY